MLAAVFLLQGLGRIFSFVELLLLLDHYRMAADRFDAQQGQQPFARIVQAVGIVDLFEQGL